MNRPKPDGAEKPVPLRAGVVELVDALDSKSSSERSVGSIPTTRTTLSLDGTVQSERVSSLCR